MRFSPLFGMALLITSVTPAALAQSSYPSTGSPVAIPDGNAVGVTSTIVVPASAPTISDLDVSLDIAHTWVGDLVVTVARGTTQALLVNRNGVFDPRVSGCFANDMVVIVDDQGTNGPLDGTCLGNSTDAQAYVRGGRYRPRAPLSVFNGTPGAGTYTLSVSDRALGDTGTLNGWALLIPGAVAGEGLASSAVSRLSVSPNPVAGQGQIDLTVATTQDVRVVLFDALGREVRVLFTRAMSAGQQAYIAFSTTDLPTGLYVVRSTGTDANLTQRITVVR